MNYRLLRVQYLFYCSAKNTILVFFRVSDQNFKLQNCDSILNRVFRASYCRLSPPTPTPPSRWKIRAPRRNRVHPQRGCPCVRERDGGGRGGAAKATDRPDQTPWRPPQSLQLEGPALPPFSDAAPSTALWNPRHTRPLYLSLSLVSALTESVDAPHFSSTTAKTNQQALLRDGVCGERGDGMRRLEGDGWDSHAHSSHSADSVGSGGCAPPSPHHPTCSFQKEGWNYLSQHRHLSPVTHSQLSLVPPCSLLVT